jgi:4-hydroxybenzoate polyprenyltransferase
MVRWWKYTKAFFKLVRWPNLIIIALTMYLLRWFIVMPLLNSTGFTSRISNPLFLFFTVATILIAGAGYVINDYFDRKTDLINRPGHVILGRILSRRTGMFWHIVLSFLGIALGVYVSYRLGLLRLSIVFVFISGLLWFYSTTYKKQVLLGNLMVAFMVACIPLLILLYEAPLLLEHYRYFLSSDSSPLIYFSAWIISYSIFAFLLTLIREIVKDLEDFEGDFAFGRQTIPIAWGVNIARKITIGITIATLLLIVVILIRYLNDLASVLYIVITVIIPLVVFIVYFSRTQSKTNYHKSSNLLKLIMLGGIGYLVIAYFFVF